MVPPAANGLKLAVTTVTLGGLIGNKNLASVFTTSTGGYSGVTALTLNPGVGGTHSYAGGIADGASGMTLTKTGDGKQISTGSSLINGSNTGTGAVGDVQTVDVTVTGAPLTAPSIFVRIKAAPYSLTRQTTASLHSVAKRKKFACPCESRFLHEV